MNALQRTMKKLINRELEEAAGKQADMRWRPQLHVAPFTGWLNDPNGLCQYKGVYHAFFQTAPFEAEGGLKFWGHCTSKDLLHWDFDGIPLLPDQTFDCHGAYSGSALTEGDTMYVFYTGNVKNAGDYNYITDGRESNTILAVSHDGKQFEKKQLLMTNEDYPADLTMHVRDPKVWSKDGLYYMVLGARTKTDVGEALIFVSEDKIHWNYLNRIRSNQTFGYMWECPDLYELDGNMILSISPQGVEADGWKYANKYQSVVSVLKSDFRTGAVTESFQELDGGFDFYAPQTFLSEDGRRIQIGWMGMADAEDEYGNPTVEDGWQHVLTFPRELSIKEGTVYQNPVRELEAWWNETTDFSGSYEGEIPSCCEIRMETVTDGLKILLSEGLELCYEASSGMFRMEFTDSKLGAGRTLRERKIGSLKNMRILIDVSCVEVFLNDGKDVFSTRFYPEKDDYCLRVVSNGEKGQICFRR